MLCVRSTSFNVSHTLSILGCLARAIPLLKAEIYRSFCVEGMPFQSYVKILSSRLLNRQDWVAPSFP